jgi:hypothetical protein
LLRRFAPRNDGGLFVIAGLDLAIHPLQRFIGTMDARVKPAHDEE